MPKGWNVRIFECQKYQGLYSMVSFSYLYISILYDEYHLRVVLSDFFPDFIKNKDKLIKFNDAHV